MMYKMQRGAEKWGQEEEEEQKNDVQEENENQTNDVQEKEEGQKNDVQEENVQGEETVSQTVNDSIN